jgi:hypothetical protein
VALSLILRDANQNGVNAIRFEGAELPGCQTEAMVLAIEIGPGDGGI